MLDGLFWLSAPQMMFYFKEMQPVGIDLGTTNSCVSYFKNDQAITIKINGRRIIPSCVCYGIHDSQPYVGEAASTASMQSNPDLQLYGTKNKIIDAKRFIGRYFNDPQVKNIVNQYEFSIESGEKDSIVFPIKTATKEISVRPEDVASDILNYIRKGVSEYFTNSSDDKIEVVITVPAYFSISQRNATKKAAESAGIEVLNLLNEPTSAGLHYIYNSKKKDIKIFVFDFGGGTLDISILHVDNKNNIKVLGVSGDLFLGGKDIDERVFNYILGKTNIKTNDLLKRRLRNDAEQIKKNLSNFTDCSSEVLSDMDEPVQITRDEFEGIIKEIYDRCLLAIEQCFEDIKYKPKDIDEVLLVGGSSHIPIFEKMIEEKFPNKKIVRTEDRAEVISHGAAIHAAMLKKKLPNPYKIYDVINLSLGYESFGGEMNIVVPKNAPIPGTFCTTASTTHTNQKEIELKIYEGERKYVRYNIYLGQINIKMPPGPAGTVIKISFQIDKNALLKVIAEYQSGTKEIQILLDESKLSPQYELNLFQNGKLIDEQFLKFNNLKIEIHQTCTKFNTNERILDLDREVCECDFDMKNSNILYDIIEKYRDDIRDRNFWDQIEHLHLK